MKRRIFTFLLAAALVLLTACSGRGTEPPVRIGEAIGEASLLRSYSAAEAFQEADADYPDAYQSVGSFSTVLYAADAVDGNRYYLDRFGLMSMREQETGDSALEQPLSRMPEDTVKELRADLEKTDALLAESLSSGERKNSSFEAYVYTQDALETLFASLNQG